MSDLLPPKGAARLQDALRAAGTGNVLFHFKDGNVLAWTLTTVEPQDDGTRRTTVIEGRG